MKVAVAGASGFVGQTLAKHLAATGHEVVALSRSGGTDSPGIRHQRCDIGDVDATTVALTGATAAYYLVHSMDSGGSFRTTDLRLADGFGRAAAAAGVERIIYVGGLGDAPSSAHLASRHEVGVALGEAGVKVVELRAAVVFGAGGISFEMLRYITERLPVMVCPRWVRTRIQPVALADLLRYLESSLDVDPGVYEIGGTDVTTYRDLMDAYASARGLRRRRILDIPWLTPHLSSYWVDLVTPVDRSTSHALIESLVTEVVVTDSEPTDRAFDMNPMGVDAALRSALDQQEAAVASGLFTRSAGLSNGIYTVVKDTPLEPGAADSVAAGFGDAGGDLGWYGAAFGWRLRIALGWILGERLRVRRPPSVTEGASVDWWRVAVRDETTLVLRSVGWVPGEAWLGYQVSGDTLRQAAAFRPRGLLGLAYWKALEPVHRIAFAQMLRRRVSG